MKTCLILIIIVCLFLVSCEQHNKNVSFFKKTEAYDLAKNVENEDLDKIEKLVKENPKLLELKENVSGSNVLSLALTIENFKSFNKLLELGANPNFINPYSKRSILIDACDFYWKPKPYTIDLRYIKLLLEKGADPNYVVEYDFIDDERNNHMATSPLHEASSLDLKMVKLLIKAGAFPNQKLKQNQRTPFSNSVSFGKYDISNYFIDSLKVNIHEPMAVIMQNNSNEVVELYIQDEVVNKFTLAKIKGDKKAIENLKENYKKIEEDNSERWMFIQKLENLGVDFKNYKFKMK